VISHAGSLVRRWFSGASLSAQQTGSVPVAIQCFEQCAEFSRIGHGSKVFHPLGWERAREIPNLVGWGDTGSFGELENLFVDLGYATCRLASTVLDDALEIFDQHGRADTADRQFSHPGEGI